MKYSNAVKIWLFLGLFLVFMQIVIGGITRLTGSGLSITEWDIVFGTLPPIGENEWQAEFLKYKQTPQYLKINQGMSLSEFKFIYFWEYIHRLWAKLMGFIFLIPCIVFWYCKMIDISIMRRLALVIFFAMLAAVFGWIMVASGLIDRPWVNAYKLSIHLSIGTAVFLSLLWVILESFYKEKWLELEIDTDKWRKVVLVIFILLCIQIVLGGIVSGMRAALTFPTWPDMNGRFVPDVLLHIDNWTSANMANYESSVFAPAMFQFLHRLSAYAILVLSLAFIYKFGRLTIHRPFRRHLWMYTVLLLIQILLGILTLINSVGSVPVGFGVFHQAIGILLLSSFFTFLWAFRKAASKYYVASI